MRFARACSVGLAFAVLAARAPAQTCLGLASFERGRMQMIGTAGANSAGTFLAAGVGLGGAGTFGQVAVGEANREDGGSATTIAAGAGYQFTLDQSSTWHLCPTASVTVFNGPNDVQTDYSQLDVTFGVALGALAQRTPPGQIVPAASLDVVIASIKATNSIGGIDTEYETFAVLGLGLGMVFGLVSVQPAVALPIGLPGGTPTLGATVSINFWEW